MIECLVGLPGTTEAQNYDERDWSTFFQGYHHCAFLMLDVGKKLLLF
jgi:hypothetical protein